jgi:hypothetical protein
MSVVVLASVVMNISDFVDIQSTQRYSTPINFDPRSPDLIAIALDASDPVIGGAFHLPAGVFKASGGGARFTAFGPVRVREDILRGFGRVGRYEVVDRDFPQADVVGKLLDRTWMESEDRNAGPFRIIVSEIPVSHFVAFRRGSFLYIVDAAALASEGVTIDW